MASARSKSLFHYTEKLKSLKGILESGFHPRYSEEDVTWIVSDPSRVAFPMVCFCDIPLSRVDDHVDFYGQYGIGLEQSWGVPKGITPVTYISHNSDHIQDFRRLGKVTKENDILELGIAFYGFLAHTKPLMGSMIRKNKSLKRYFYKECEWRFIPKIKRDHIDSFMSPEKYKNKELLEKNHRLLKDSYPLKFSAKNVRHIILKDESEIPEIYEFIENLKHYSKEEKRILNTRITTLSAIKDDY